MSLREQLRRLAFARFPQKIPRSASLGQRGEAKAAQFLTKQRMRIVSRGYRNSIGEIDLIAVDKSTCPKAIVFIEVKTRTSDQKGLPVEAVDGPKQERITNTAMVYLKQHHLLECRVRFDIVGILWPAEAALPTIQHFRNAFQPTGQGQMFR